MSRRRAARESLTEAKKEANKQVIGVAIVGFAFGSTVTWNVWGNGAIEVKNAVASLLAGVVLALVGAAFAMRYARKQ